MDTPDLFTRVAATHESGHAVIAIALGIKVEEVSISPDDENCAGATYTSQPRHTLARDAVLLFLLAGGCAARKYLRSVCGRGVVPVLRTVNLGFQGDSADLEVARTLVRDARSLLYWTDRADVEVTRHWRSIDWIAQQCDDARRKHVTDMLVQAVEDDVDVDVDSMDAAMDAHREQTTAELAEARRTVERKWAEWNGGKGHGTQ
jgi:hypothetical protein